MPCVFFWFSTARDDYRMFQHADAVNQVASNAFLGPCACIDTTVRLPANELKAIPSTG